MPRWQPTLAVLYVPAQPVNPDQLPRQGPSPGRQASVCRGFRALEAARRRDPAVETCLLPETTDVMLVSMPGAMRFPWRFLFDLLSLEHRTPQEVNGHCFRTLVVGVCPAHQSISCNF